MTTPPARPEVPGHGAVPPAAPRGRWGRRERVAAVGTAAFVVVGSGLGLLLSRHPGPSTPREAVEDFVAAQAGGDYRAAFALLCPAVRGYWDSPAAFARDVAVNDDLFTPGTEARVTGLRADPQQDPGAFLVRTDLRRTGPDREVDFLVLREDGGYRVCGFAGD